VLNQQAQLKTSAILDPSLADFAGESAPACAVSSALNLLPSHGGDAWSGIANPGHAHH
jgi:hypothetical protein